MIESLFPLSLARRQMVEGERLLEVGKVGVIEQIVRRLHHDEVEIRPVHDVDGVVTPSLG